MTQQQQQAPEHAAYCDSASERQNSDGLSADQPQRPLTQYDIQTIASKHDPAGETREDLKVRMAEPIDLTGSPDKVEVARARLYELRDNLKADQILHDLPIQLEVITADVIDTLPVADVVYEIGELLKQKTKTGNYIKLQQHNTEILLTEEDALDGFSRLKSLKSYLSEKTTPKSLFAKLEIRVESPAIFEACTKELHEINLLTRKYPNVALKVKTQHGTSTEARRKLENLYRLRARYYDGNFRVTTTQFSKDLEDLHRLVECASRDSENPDKRITIVLPKDDVTPEQAKRLAEYIEFFSDNYPGAFEIKNPRALFSRTDSNYWQYFYAESLMIGGSSRPDADILKDIASIRKELYARFLGDSKSTHRILIQVRSKSKISLEVKKAYAELVEFDQWLQRESVHPTMPYDFKEGKIPYHTHYIEFDDRTTFKMPGLRTVHTQELVRNTYRAGRELGRQFFSGAASFFSGTVQWLGSLVPRRTRTGLRQRRLFQ